MGELYTVDQVASLLGLHVKTVRGYVRDGRLRATRIGKSYRIARADLEAFAGGPVEREPPRRSRGVEVSTVVEMSAVSPELMTRLAAAVGAAAASSSVPADGDPGRLRVQTIYDEQRGSMKVLLFGDLTRTIDALRMIEFGWGR